MALLPSVAKEGTDYYTIIAGCTAAPAEAKPAEAAATSAPLQKAPRLPKQKLFIATPCKASPLARKIAKEKA